MPGPPAGQARPRKAFLVHPWPPARHQASPRTPPAPKALEMSDKLIDAQVDTRKAAKIEPAGGLDFDLVEPDPFIAAPATAPPDDANLPGGSPPSCEKIGPCLALSIRGVRGWRCA